MIFYQECQFRVLALGDINNIDNKGIIRQMPCGQEHPPASVRFGLEPGLEVLNTLFTLQLPEEQVFLIIIQEKVAKRQLHNIRLGIPEHGCKPAVDLFYFKGLQVNKTNAGLCMVEEAAVFHFVPPHVGGKT